MIIISFLERINQTTRRYLERIPKQLRGIQLQLWNISERRESFTSRFAEEIGANSS